MKKIVIAFILIITLMNLNAQKVVALHSNGVVTMFNTANPVNDAYAAAQNKDTIYIPGGYFAFPTNISKRLTIFGAGHYPDSTLATTKTILNNGCTFYAGSDSCFISGMEFSGNLVFDGASPIQGIRVTRTKFQAAYLYGSVTNYKKGFIFKDCVFGIVDGQLVAQFLTVSNCVVENTVMSITGNGLIQNNIFLAQMGCGGCGYWNVHGVDNSLIQNNVFYGNHPYYVMGNNNNVFNNLFASTPSYGTNVYTGNYINIGQGNLVVSATPSAFSYSSNYHLQAPSTYLGNDATQVGIYGGTMGAYKEGAVPIDPHIYFKSVAPTTNASGQLLIQYKVKAQIN